MSRRTKSTARKTATRKAGRKSTQRLSGGSKDTRHRRNFAGCIACRVRGKKCDQQQIPDGEGCPTCEWCRDHGVPCTGGFGIKRLPGLTNRWKDLFRLRVKLYMGETGQARGIRGWKRSDPLRETCLSREEIEGYIFSHYDLSEEEEEAHYNCIYMPNGVCALVQPMHMSFAHSPMTSIEARSDFGSPVLSPDDVPWSPRVPGAEFNDAPHSSPALVGEVNVLSAQMSEQLDFSLFPAGADDVFDPELLGATTEGVCGSCGAPKAVREDVALFEFSQDIIAPELL